MTSRIVYLKDRFTVHDQRFIRALTSAGHAVRRAVVVDGSGQSSRWRFDDGVELTGEELVATGPDFVQVGPLDLLESCRDFVTELRVVATCWGSEGLAPFTDEQRRVLRSASHIVADCKFVADVLARATDDRVPITRFAWGIDLDVFHPPAPIMADTQPSLRSLVVTRSLEALYDHETIVEAFVQASRRVDDLELVFYGSGSLAAALADRAAPAGERVVFRSPVTEPELAPILRRATAWVNAAPLDGISISLLQALASGCMVLTADTPCGREAVGPSDARFFAPGDVPGLVELMVAARRPDAIALARNTSWVRAFADWSSNSRRYLSIFEGAA